jgi:flagellar L-ring protein precursor FlgH
MSALLLGLLSFPAAGQSLWANRQPQRAYLFADTASRHVGDLVTIIISENTDVENRDQRKMNKSAETKFNLDFSSGGDLGEGEGNLDINKSSSRAFNGNSQFDVEQEFLDRITVEVVDIQPNGNLVLGGRRKRLVAGEQRTLIVSGIARAVDISPDNTIRSQHIANFQVCYEGDGPQTSFTRQGWAGRFLNKVWPF